MASIFQTAVTQALATQPWYIRRKDSLTAAAGLILQVLNVLAAYTADMPEWANIAIAATIGVCQILIHAQTPGAITPSQARRLENAGMEATMIRTPESGYTTPVGHVDPVLDAVVDNGDAYQAGRDANWQEGGRHRAD